MTTVFTYSTHIDNAPCKNVLENSTNEIQVLTWPTNSSDLSPIERLWHVLGKQL